MILQQDSPGTLHYVDPPYALSTRGDKCRGSGAGQVYRHEMTDDAHRELAQVLPGARGMVVLSGYPCALYDEELYPDWPRVSRRARADGARERTEVLWLSPRTWERLAAERSQGVLMDEERTLR